MVTSDKGRTGIEMSYTVRNRQGPRAPPGLEAPRRGISPPVELEARRQLSSQVARHRFNDI